MKSHPPAGSAALIGIACVRNEEDIIEAFVRHNLALLDHLVIADHRSCDDTPEILRQLGAEGLSLTVVQDLSLGNDHGGRVSRLLHYAAALPGAEWIFPLDADEFLHFGPGFSAELAAAEGAVVKLPLRHYLAHPGDDSAESNPALRLRHRLTLECEEEHPPAKRPYVCFKVVVRATAAHTPHSRISQGNHRFEVAGTEVPAVFPAQAHIAHFSIREAGQYATKLALWSLENLTHPTLHAKAEDFYLSDYEAVKRSFSGFQEASPVRPPAWLPLHESFPKGQPATCEDPFAYQGGPLLYPAHRTGADRFIRQLLGHAEELARQVHQLTIHAPPHAGAETHLWIEGAPGSVLAAAPSVQRVELALPADSERLRLNIAGPAALLQIQRLDWVRADGTTVPPRLIPRTTKLILHGGLDVSEDGHREIAKQAGTLALDLRPFGAPPPAATGLLIEVVFSDSLAEIGKRLLTPPIPGRLQHAFREHGYALREMEKIRTWKGFLRHRLRSWLRSRRPPPKPTGGA